MNTKFNVSGNVGSQNFSISGSVYNTSKEQEKPLGGFVFDAVCAGCPYYIRSVSEEKSPNSKKVHRNPIVWRGKYINVSRTSSGRLQPHFRELSLGGILERDLFPYKVAAELYQAQKDLKVNLEEGSGLDFNQREC